jgi:hypothetical protein
MRLAGLVEIEVTLMGNGAAKIISTVICYQDIA